MGKTVNNLNKNSQQTLDLSAYSQTNHTHNYAGSSSAGGAAISANKVNTNLVVKLNSGTTEGTSLFTFNGSAAKTINITPSAIGAATSSHGTHVTYSTTAPKVASTAAVGSESTVARGDHVHAAQTSVSGNAGTATKLQTARTIQIGNKSNSFDGSANITYTLADIGAAASSHGTHLTIGTGASNAAAGNHTHTNVLNQDTRAVNTTPDGVPIGLSVHLKSNGTDSLSDDGTYHSSLFIKGWNDYSGGPYGNIAISANNNLWYRASSSGTAWNSWKKVSVDGHTHDYAPSSSTSLNTTDKTIVGAINEVFQSGNDAKKGLVDALVAKGQSCSTSDTWSTLTGKISNLVAPAGTAVASNVLTGKTFINSTGSTVTGTMANQGSKTITPSASKQTLGAGYYSGITINGNSNLKAANIVEGVTIFGVAGTAKTGGYYFNSDNTGVAEVTLFQDNAQQTYRTYDTWTSLISDYTSAIEGRVKFVFSATAGNSIVRVKKISGSTTTYPAQTTVSNGSITIYSLTFDIAVGDKIQLEVNPSQGYPYYKYGVTIVTNVCENQ